MNLPIKVECILFSKTNSDYKFLLVKRVPEDGDFWQPLTETLEDGETINECILRGLKEELGLENFENITERIWSFSWENKLGEPNIDLVYGVAIKEGAKVKLNPLEHSEYKWCSYDEAIELLGKENNKKAFGHFKEKIIEGEN